MLPFPQKMNTKRWLLLMAVVVVVAALTAAVVAIASPAAYRYRTEVGMSGLITTLLQPGLTASPTSVNFDTWAQGTKSPVRTIEVTNAGDTTRTRLNMSATGLPAGVTFLVSYLPSTPVAPGGKWTIYLQLDAATTVPDNTPVSGTVVIEAE